MLHKALSRLAVFLSVLPMFAIGQTTILTAPPNDPNWNYTSFNPAVNTNINGPPSSNTNPSGSYIDNFSGTNTTNTWSNFPGTTNIDNPQDPQNTSDFWAALAYPINSVFCWQPSQVTLTTIGASQTQSSNMVGSTAVQFSTQQSNICNTNGLIGGGMISTNTFGPYGYYTANMQLNNGQQQDQGLWMQGSSIYQSINMEVVSTYEYDSQYPQWAQYNDIGPYAPNLIFNECMNEPNPCGSGCNDYLQTPYFSDPDPPFSSPNLATTFNTMGWDWEPNYITYYLNGTPVASIANDGRIPNVPMNIYLNSGWNTPNIVLNENEIPGSMYVANFSMYHLKSTSCGNTISFNSNSQVTAYGNPNNNYAVQYQIFFAGGNIDMDYCTPPTGYSFVFRAVNGITINNTGGFSFTAGTNGKPLVLMPTGCPN